MDSDFFSSKYAFAAIDFYHVDNDRRNDKTENIRISLS